jgi:HEPN domain-containing protein
MRDALEWEKQSDYDYETAEYMFNGGRYFYAVFMCHLSIEKILKGLFISKFKNMPPKNHNLVYFVEKLELKLEAEYIEFISELNLASVATRYPDDLAQLGIEFTQNKTKQILENTKLILQWLKKELMK